MAKTKKSIPGRKIAPGVIKVDLSGRKDLIQGQKVLIYKPTSKAIIGTTGRIIGQKEKILGIGEVVAVGDKVVVKAPRTGNRNLLGVRNGAVKVSNRSNWVKSRKLGSLKFKVDPNVYIKPVEE